MTEYKKLIYELEDTMELGRTLPLVAMKQLPKIADKFRILPDIPDYQPGTSITLAQHIETFVSENSQYLDDERELKDIFKESIKRGHYSKKLLLLFEQNRQS